LHRDRDFGLGRNVAGEAPHLARPEIAQFRFGTGIAGSVATPDDDVGTSSDEPARHGEADPGIRPGD
jgi:hypothetical protein